MTAEIKEMSIYESLSKIQCELKCPKTRGGNGLKYKYRNCEDILDAIKHFLNEEKLFLTISDEMVSAGDRFYIKAIATISNGKENISVSAYAREDVSSKNMSVSQLTGSASSYARKYALNGLLAIDDSRDADELQDAEKSVPEKQEETPHVKLYTLKKMSWKHDYPIDEWINVFVTSMPKAPNPQKFFEDNIAVLNDIKEIHPEFIERAKAAYKSRKDELDNLSTLNAG